MRDICDVRLALEGAFETAVPQAAAPAVAAHAATASSPLWRLAALVVAAVAGATVWVATRPAEPVPPRVSRLLITSAGRRRADHQRRRPRPGDHAGRLARRLCRQPRHAALRPRARRPRAGGGVHRRAARAVRLPRWPVDRVRGRRQHVEESGGDRRPGGHAGDARRQAPRGATWAPDDTIIFATTDAATGLQRVAAAGGPTTVLTRPDRAQGEADHLWPELLPGGRAVLFTITAVDRRPRCRAGGRAGPADRDADGPRARRQSRPLRAERVGSPEPCRARGGHLVYAAAGTLRAVPFDLASLKTRGTPVPVVPDVVTTSLGGVDAVVAGDGTLAYVSGARRGGAQRTLVWVDRQGRETPIPAPPRAYVYPRLSPDGTRVAVYANDQERDIWIWDLGRTTLTRVTFDPGSGFLPGVDARRPPADLQFGAGRRTESLLAGGGRHRRGRAADRESQPAECDGRLARRPPADLHRDGPEDGRGRDAGGVGRDRTASRRSCSPRSPSGTASSRPTAAGSRTRRMTRAGSRSPCGRFPT